MTVSLAVLSKAPYEATAQASMWHDQPPTLAEAMEYADFKDTVINGRKVFVFARSKPSLAWLVGDSSNQSPEKTHYERLSLLVTGPLGYTNRHSDGSLSNGSSNQGWMLFGIVSDSAYPIASHSEILRSQTAVPLNVLESRAFITSSLWLELKNSTAEYTHLYDQRDTGNVKVTLRGQITDYRFVYSEGNEPDILVSTTAAVLYRIRANQVDVVDTLVKRVTAPTYQMPLENPTYAKSSGKVFEEISTYRGFLVWNREDGTKAFLLRDSVIIVDSVNTTGKSLALDGDPNEQPLAILYSPQWTYVFHPISGLGGGLYRIPVSEYKFSSRTRVVTPSCHQPAFYCVIDDVGDSLRITAFTSEQEYYSHKGEVCSLHKATMLSVQNRNYTVGNNSIWCPGRYLFLLEACRSSPDARMIVVDLEKKRIAYDGPTMRAIGENVGGGVRKLAGSTCDSLFLMYDLDSRRYTYQQKVHQELTQYWYCQNSGSGCIEAVAVTLGNTKSVPVMISSLEISLYLRDERTGEQKFLYKVRQPYSITLQPGEWRPINRVQLETQVYCEDVQKVYASVDAQ